MMDKRFSPEDSTLPDPYLVTLLQLNWIMSAVAAVYAVGLGIIVVMR